jgi:hypothetical protein
MWLALASFLFAGLAATFFLYRYRLPIERRAAGRALLAAMDWGDFTQLVLAVLNNRGYERGFGGGGTEGEYLLQRRGQDWLLSSRHSRAYVPGSTAIAEFANHLRQRGIQGGILAIPGRFPRAAFGLGRAHRVELLDGATMWEELQPLLSDKQHAAIDRPARVKWQLALAWLIALFLAVAVYLLAHPVHDLPSTPTALPAGALLGRDHPRAPASTTAPDRVQGALLPILERRKALAAVIARLPHVELAAWPTDSTLLVKVDSESFDPHAKICPLLEQDQDLRASRLQVQYPPGSTRPVRFLQCRAY